jgi:uncharacterized membrane protein
VRGHYDRSTIALTTSVRGYRVAVAPREWSARARALIQRASAWLRVPEHAGLAIVSVVALAYITIWCSYLFGRQDIFKTTAEDLGIMDQALWATVHGQFMRETICNPISDMNCLAGTMRFAIHFEPILLPISLLYLLAPTPKLLLLLQTTAIASGMYPTYLLALRRLKHPGWGIAFSALFLLCPAVQAAVVDDFHPEVFAAPLLLWALYCVETRRDRSLIAVCAVILLCKETLALAVLCLGLYVALRYHRRRLGQLLCAMAVGTLLLALFIMHVTSPLGHSPVTDRFDVLFQHPFSTLLVVLLDPQRYAYMAGLFAQTGFLALLSPWMLAILAPNIAVNVLSSNPNMYSGSAQYNVYMAPFLVVGAMDGLVRLRQWLPGTVPWVERHSHRLAPALYQTIFPRVAAGVHHLRLAYPTVARRLTGATLVPALLVVLCSLGFQQSLWRDYDQYAAHGWWPSASAHTCLAYDLLAMIPPHVSVSAQSWLVPHLSERMDIYQFPSGEERADYVLLDVTSGWYYPFNDASDYVSAFQQLLRSGDFEILAAQDGYLLLRRLPSGLRASLGHPLTLPPSFFTFATAAPPNTNFTTLARYLSEAQMFGYDATSAPRVSPMAPPVVPPLRSCHA